MTNDLCLSFTYNTGTTLSIVSNTHHPHVHNSYGNVAAVAAAATTFAYASPSTLGHPMSNVSSTSVTTSTANSSTNGQRSNVSHHHSSPGHHSSTGVISSSPLSRHPATSLLPYSAIYGGLGMTSNANFSTINSNSTELSTISNCRQLSLTHHQSPLLTPPPSSSDITRGSTSSASTFKPLANRSVPSVGNLFSSPSSSSSSTPTDGQTVTPSPSGDQLLMDSVGHSVHPSQTQTSSSASSLV